eukprot:359854-Chlamydomonas_euryale.AAC.1
MSTPATGPVHTSPQALSTLATGRIHNPPQALPTPVTCHVHNFHRPCPHPATGPVLLKASSFGTRARSPRFPPPRCIQHTPRAMAASLAAAGGPGGGRLQRAGECAARRRCALAALQPAAWFAQQRVA